ncbi:hypothetical protein DEAC_c43170 [Desulfosporosinus acididurans]|uniref:Uncharacterized protein n=1 Tax=Desulfosporosinus acididurans TaxID=476652 RepID=A0A0J1FJV3_9FIRM|nr:hypothetical protein [Desulfosporosinus acididurans]KLU63749.1 hypothetical protein DEAC_c43170 [Desulfosporosinus acididurans]
MLKDRFIAGGIAGLVASVTCDIVGIIYKSLGWTDRTFNDYATIILTYQVYSNEGFFGLILSIISHVAVCIILGVIFAYLIKFTSSNYLYIKGLGYSLVIWLLLNTFGTILNLPLFRKMPLNVAYATLSTALIYGLMVALTLRLIDKKMHIL